MKRAVAAVFATALLAAVIVVTVSALVDILSRDAPSADGLVSVISFLFVFATVFALPYAAFLGVLIEWRKMKGAVRSPSGFGRQIAASVFGGILVVAIPGLLYAAIAGGRPEENIVGVLIAGILWGAFGGMCSGICWWLLVTRPQLRKGAQIV